MSKATLLGAVAGFALTLAACADDAASATDTVEMAEAASGAEAAQSAETAPEIAPEIANDPIADPVLWPEAVSPIGVNAEIEARVADILSRMTLEEKVGQIIQADISAVTPEEAQAYHLGSILNGGNSGPGGDNYAPPEAWLELADAYWDASTDTEDGGVGIPILWGTDAVHGHNNIVGATLFPHNIGLGAANDAELIRDIGEVTAAEVRVTGQDWTFAPTLAVVRDDRWGRSYEGYSESPDIVARYATAMVEGLQGEPGSEAFLADGHVLATAKHFLGDGGTDRGIDQGDNRDAETDLATIHGAGYPPAIEAGVQTVMASFSSWHGIKMHGNEELLTDVLVDRMGFDGFVVGDWNGHGQVDGCTPVSCAAAFNAGLDMFMAPDSWRELYDNTLQQVRDGEISMERLDEAVSRILRVKLRLGLFEAGRPSERALAGESERLGSAEHRDVARRAVRQSLVLLKNEGGVLPIEADARVLVAGEAADSIAQAAGGWTINWQGEGNENSDFPNGQSIWGGIEEAVSEAGGTAEYSPDGSFDTRPDVAIVVFGEEPYAEFQGDRSDLDFAPTDGLDLLRQFESQDIPVIAVFLSGRPMWVNPELNASDAFVAVWLPGSEGGGVADVLIGDADGAARHDFTGRLSFSWPAQPEQTPLNVGDEEYSPLFAYGYGLDYSAEAEPLGVLDESAQDRVADHRGGMGLMLSGRAQEDYGLVLRGAGGARETVDGPAVTLADGSLEARSADRYAQEDVREIRWSGAADFAIEGPAQDWSGRDEEGLGLALTYLVETAPTDAVELRMECAGEAGCAGVLDVRQGLAIAAGKGWREAVIPLSCFVDAGVELDQVTAPFVIRSAGELAMSISDIRVRTMPETASCEL